MKKKTVLIAGSSGFLGTALAGRLKAKNIRICEGDKDKYDFRNLKDCLRATRGVDTVIVAAGIITSRRDQAQRPAEILCTNTSIDLNILEACRANKVKEIIFVSSIVAYSSGARNPLSETELLKGITLNIQGNVGFYNLSKWLTIPLAFTYTHQYGIKVRVVLFPSMYGPDGKFHHAQPPLVPNLILGIHKAMRAGKDFRAGSGPGNTIDLLYIDDACAFLETLLQKFGKEQFLLVNAGADKAYRFNYVCSIIARQLKFKGRIIWDDAKVAKPVYLNNSVAKKLGWKPRTSLDQGIQKTVAWFLKSRYAR